MRKNGARTLLMGGQACVFYGAAEFSRDVDLLILTDDLSLRCIASALAELQAAPIAVPSLDSALLARGHAVHFRCSREDVSGLRVDLMSSLRGVAGFNDLWNRRTTIEVDGEAVDMMALEDLVLAKKTQRDKDWPMIRRLVEQSYYSGAGKPEFWLRELRTAELLVDAVHKFPELARTLAAERPALRAAIQRSLSSVTEALAGEELAERQRDRAYWDPLKRELAEFRRAKRLSEQGPAPPT